MDISFEDVLGGAGKIPRLTAFSKVLAPHGILTAPCPHVSLFLPTAWRQPPDSVKESCIVFTTHPVLHVF